MGQCVRGLAQELGGSLTGSLTPKAPQSPLGKMKSYTLIDFSELGSTFKSLPEQSVNATAAAQHSSTSLCLLDEELMSLGPYLGLRDGVVLDP